MYCIIRVIAFKTAFPKFDDSMLEIVATETFFRWNILNWTKFSLRQITWLENSTFQISIRVVHMVNGRFYYPCIWYNITKIPFSHILLTILSLCSFIWDAYSSYTNTIHRRIFCQISSGILHEKKLFHCYPVEIVNQLDFDLPSLWFHFQAYLWFFKTK